VDNLNQSKGRKKSIKKQLMVKIKGKLIDVNKIGPLAYSKRTIKKSTGDDYTHNVRCVGLKSKRRKRKEKNF